ncbi:MAG: DnaJ domain-containing protein [bacterium]
MAPAPDQHEDLYEILQVHPNASPAMIRKVYGWLAQQFHPDKNPERREWAEGKMRALNGAFETLSDPVKRKQYNEKYAGVVLRGTGKRVRTEGAPAGWKRTVEDPVPDPEYNPNPNRSTEEREARRQRYYTSQEEAYATDDAPPGSAAYEFRRAQDYVERKRYDRAIRHYRRALNLDPDNPTIMVELAMAYYLNLNLGGAREWLEKALTLNPSIADAEYMLGMIALDDTVLQAIERDQAGRPLYQMRSQRRYFALLGRAVEHFEKALFLNPMVFRKQFTFFPTRKSVTEFAAAEAVRVRSIHEFGQAAKNSPLLRQALTEWYFDHVTCALGEGANGDGQFLGNLRRLMPRNGVKMFLNSWAYAAVRRGLELYPEDLTLLKAYEKLLANGLFLGEQPMSRDLTAELKKQRSDTYIRIRMKDTSFTPSPQQEAPYERWTLGFVAVGLLMVVFMVWKVTEFLAQWR